MKKYRNIPNPFTGQLFRVLSDEYVSDLVLQTLPVNQYDIEVLNPGESETLEHLSDSSYTRIIQISRSSSELADSLDFGTGDEVDYYQEDDTKTEIIDNVIKLKGIGVIPYAHYHLNSIDSGDSIEDSSGNGRDGVAINTPSVVAGKLNNCLLLGASEYVDLGDIANFERTDTFSIECWLKTSTGSTAIISKMYLTPSIRGWAIFNTGAGKIGFRFTNTSPTNRIFVTGDTTITDNTWHHVVVTYDGSSSASGVTIYVDNDVESLTIGADTLTATTQGSAKCVLSSYDGTANFFIGNLDEVVFYDQELTSEEVAVRWNSGNGTEQAGGYDITKGWYVRTDANQIDTSSWYNIGYLRITQTTPINTDIRYLVSIEGHDTGTNWKKWNGASWITVDLTNIDTQGMTKTEIEALTDVEFEDLFIDGTGTTLDIIASLKTTNALSTPELDQIDVTYLTDYRYLAYDDDFKVEFLDATHTKVTNVSSPPEPLSNLKINILTRQAL